MKLLRTILMIAAVLLVPVRTGAQQKAVVELHSYLIPDREEGRSDTGTSTEAASLTDPEGITVSFSMSVLDFPMELPAFFSFSQNTGLEPVMLKSEVNETSTTDLKPGSYKVCVTSIDYWEGDVSKEMFKRQEFESAELVLKAGKNVIIHLRENTPLAPQLFSERVAQVLAAAGYGPESDVEIRRFGNFLIIN